MSAKLTGIESARVEMRLFDGTVWDVEFRHVPIDPVIGGLSVVTDPIEMPTDGLYRRFAPGAKHGDLTLSGFVESAVRTSPAGAPRDPGTAVRLVSQVLHDERGCFDEVVAQRVLDALAEAGHLATTVTAAAQPPAEGGIKDV